jgi:hypothetical protein
MHGPRSSVRLGWLGAALLMLASTGSRADNKYLEIPPKQAALASAAYRHANSSDEEVRDALRSRSIRYEPATPPLPGVRFPIRLTGPLRGVSIHSALPAEERGDSPFEILDGRLALVLDDLCRILARHGVVELVHYTMYRPSAATPKDRNGFLPRHPGGLAIDLGALRKRDGQWLVVGSHWSPAIGSRTCGQGARRLDDPKGRELQSIVCEAYDARIFHYMLSPHFDRPHADHLHLEIKPIVEWFLVN